MNPNRPSIDLEGIYAYFAAVKWLDDNRAMSRLPSHQRSKEYWNNIDIKRDGRQKMDWWVMELLEDRKSIKGSELGDATRPGPGM